MVHYRVYTTLSMALATITLAACGGGGSSSTPSSALPAAVATNAPTSPAQPSNPTSAVSLGSISTKPFAIGEKRYLAPNEKNYGGTFTVATTNAGVISVTPQSGAGPFLLTGIAPGSATITAADTSGRHASLTFSVIASAAPPAASPAPVATGTPGASPAPTATPTPIVLPVPNGSSAPGQPTPTPIALTVPIDGLGSVDLGAASNVVSSVLNPAIASVVSAGNGLYDIVGNAAGQTQVAFTSSAGTTTLNVTVPATPPLITVPNASLTLQLGNALGANSAVVSAGAPGSSGAFTASIQNSGIAVVAPVLLTNNQFIVTSVGPGTTLLMLQDSFGHTQYLSINVP